MFRASTGCKVPPRSRNVFHLVVNVVNFTVTGIYIANYYL